MDSSLNRLPADFERALADLRAARTAVETGPIDIQIWRAADEIAVAIAYRPGRGENLVGSYDGRALFWTAEDGLTETTQDVDSDVASYLGAGLLVVYLDPESNAPVGEGVLVHQTAGGI